MEIELSELLEGKPTIIKNKEYLSTKEYVEPFLDICSPFVEEFTFQVQTPKQMSLSKDSTDLIYNRVLIQGVLPKEHDYDNHSEVVGFLYGLDTKKPVAKIYRGYLNRACTNLSVFSPEWLHVQEINPEKEINYNVKDLLNLANNFKNELRALKQEFVNRDMIYNHLGKWVDYCLTSSYDNGIYDVKIPHSLPVTAYKSVFLDKKSIYYRGETTEVSLFDIHEAMTQVITDGKSDITNRYEKTLMVNDMINLIREAL